MRDIRIYLILGLVVLGVIVFNGLNRASRVIEKAQTERLSVYETYLKGE